MKWFVSLSVLGIAACSPPPIEVKADQERGGERVSTKLIALDSVSKLGGPIRLRLELRNSGSTSLSYVDAAIGSEESIELLDQSGVVVSQIPSGGQIFAQEKELAPSGVALLLDGYDLSEHFLIDRPGKYRIRFTGHGLSLPTEDRGSSQSTVFASNWVEVEVGEGRPSPLVEVFKRVKSILPSGWDITANGANGEITIILWRSHLKGDDVRIEIGAVSPQGGAKLGGSPWGTVWIIKPSVIEDNVRDDLINALSR